MSHAGLDSRDVVINAAFVCGLTNIACGVLSNLPLGLMPGVGPNVLLAFGLVANGVCTTDQVLAVSMMAGMCLTVFALTPINKLFIGLVPLSVRYGLIIGTGLLSALIGLKAVNVVVPDHGDNIVALGVLDSLEARICSVFLILIVSMLHFAVKGAVLVGMLGATLTVWVLSGSYPTTLVSVGLPSFHALDFSILSQAEAWVNIGALDLMMRFSTCAALMSSARMAGLMRPDGGVNGGTSVYLCCGLATMLSAALGSSPVFVSMAASAGIQDGGRTGIVSIVVGVYALLTSFLLAPLISAIPKAAISPVLLLVGVSMMGEAAHIEWKKIDRALPAFMCAIFQPFTFSVAHGINAGLGMSLVLFFSTGQFVRYMPSLQKRFGLTDTYADNSSTMGSFSRQVSDSRDERRFHPRLNRPSSEPVLVQQEDQVELIQHLATYPGHPSSSDEADPSLQVLGSVRQPLHSLGVGARRNAEQLVDQVAEFIGFDKDAVHAIFEERLESGRTNNFSMYKEQCTLKREGVHASMPDLTKAAGG